MGEMERTMPILLTKDEGSALLLKSERLWKNLRENDLGGFADGNRPFYILWAFEEVIEEFGNRDVGLTWSKNQLDAAAVSPVPHPDVDKVAEAVYNAMQLSDDMPEEHKLPWSLVSENEESRAEITAIALAAIKAMEG